MCFGLSWLAPAQSQLVNIVTELAKIMQLCAGPLTTSFDAFVAIPKVRKL